MTTTEKTTTNGTETPAPVVKELFLDQITVQKNTRSRIALDALKEFQENIAKDGLINPVTVRPDGEGSFILVAGERRLRAHINLGKKTILARIMEIDEAKAREIQIVENLHREDIGPLDEARAFSQLVGNGQKLGELDDKLFTARVVAVAQMVGKPTNYIHRSLALLNLPAKVIAKIETKELTPAHGHQLLRLLPKQMEALADFAVTPHPWFKRLPTLDELRMEVEKRAMKSLKDAVFPKDKPFAGKVACTVCPLNTGNQGVLFDGAVEGGCTGPECYNAKTRQVWKDVELVGRTKYPTLKSLGTVVRGYNGTAAVKGFAVVQKANAKIQKLVTEKPQAFAFAVERPNAHQKTKPEVLLVVTDPKAVGMKEIKQQERAGFDHAAYEREQEQRRTINHHTVRALMMEVGKKALPWTKDKAMRVFDAHIRDESIPLILAAMGFKRGEKVTRKDILALSLDQIHAGIWLSTFSTWNPESLVAQMRALKLPTQTALAEGRKAGAKAWEEAEKIHPAEAAKKA